MGERRLGASLLQMRGVGECWVGLGKVFHQRGNRLIVIAPTGEQDAINGDVHVENIVKLEVYRTPITGRR